MSKETAKVSNEPGKKGKSKMSDAVSGTEAIRTWDDHKIGTEALAKKFSTNKDSGLSSGQIKDLLAKYGENALTKKEAVPWYCLFLHEMIGFFSLLLWFGSALCFIGFIIQTDKEDLSNLYLGIVLAVVTFLTGCFSYAQSSKSAEMMAQFENFIPPIAYVIRDGKEEKVDAK
jgi:sodium/potassium-transporting ATPase subunit alpha